MLRYAGLGLGLYIYDEHPHDTLWQQPGQFEEREAEIEREEAAAVERAEAAAAQLLQEEQAAAEAQQRAREAGASRKSKKARQKQRKQVCSCCALFRRTRGASALERMVMSGDILACLSAGWLAAAASAISGSPDADMPDESGKLQAIIRGPLTHRQVRHLHLSALTDLWCFPWDARGVHTAGHRADRQRSCNNDDLHRCPMQGLA